MVNKNVWKKTLSFILSLAIVGSMPFSLYAVQTAPPTDSNISQNTPPSNIPEQNAPNNNQSGVYVNGEAIETDADIVWFKQIWNFDVRELRNGQYMIYNDRDTVDNNISANELTDGTYEVDIYGNGADIFKYYFGLDSVNPEHTSIYNTQNNSLRFFATDELSGVDKYCINGSDRFVEPDEYGIVYDIKDAGSASVIDKAGNFSEYKPPEQYTLSINTNGYTFSDSKPSTEKITLTPSLNGTGSYADYKFQYSNDSGSTWIDVTGGNISVTNTEGAEEYIIRAVCNDDSNFEICRSSAKVNADTLLPDKAVVTITGEKDANNWYITVPSISITAPSKDTTTYTWDGTEYPVGAGQTVEVPKDKINDGNHVLTVTVTDSAGNSSSDKYELNVNAVAPEISSITVNTSYRIDSDTKTVYCKDDLSLNAAVNSETVKIIPVCDGAELDSSRYTVDGNTITINSNTSIRGKLGIKAVDAQNTEKIYYVGTIGTQNDNSFTSSTTVSADEAYTFIYENVVLEKPEIKVSYTNPEGKNIENTYNKDTSDLRTPWTNGNFNVSFSKTNEKEFAYQYKISDSENWIDYDGNAVISENGTYDFRSISESGVNSEILSVQFRIYRNTPQPATLTVAGGSSSSTGWYGDIALDLRNNNEPNDSIPTATTHCDILRTDTNGTNKVGYIKISNNGTIEQYNLDENISLAKEDNKVSIGISETGIYELQYWTTDEAGNGTEMYSQVFKLQNEKPVIYSLDFEDRNILTSKSLFFMSADLSTLSVNADFGFSGPADEDAVVYEYKSVLSDEWKICSNVNLFRNDKYDIRVTIKNKAGISAQSNSSTIVVDSRMPVGENNAPEITMRSSGTEQNGIYSSDVNMHIAVIDPKENNVCSGLNRVSYRIENNETGEVVTSGNLFNYDISNYNSIDDIQPSFSGDITVPSSLNSNDITVYVEAEDNAGNIKLSSQNLKIDTISSDITVSYDNNKTVNGIFDAVRTATITIDETNFNADDVVINTKNSDGDAPEISSWSSYGSVHVATVSFSSDGDYTFDMDYTDLAGNPSTITYSGEQTSSFTIDMTNPEIDIEYDNNDAENSTYYDKKRTATITVTDKNIDSDLLKNSVKITALLNGKAITAPTSDKWSTSGNTSTCIVEFNEDADYTIEAVVSDKAGNSKQYTKEAFTIDTKAPEILITGVEDKSANKDAVVPIVEYSDVNLNDEKVEITLTGANKGNIPINKENFTITNGSRISINNFADNTELDDDDLYTLTVNVTDKSGLSSSKSIEFSINRTGPVYVIDSSLENYLNSYNKEAQNIKVTVYDVDPLISTVISVIKDGNSIGMLTENSDYSVKETAPTEEAYRYTYEYVITSANFEQNGSYNVVVTAKDSADNSSDNTVAKLSMTNAEAEKTENEKSAEIRFTIDNIAPTVLFDNLSSNGKYNTDSKTVSFIMHDNISSLSADSVEVYINNEKAEITDDGEKYEFTIGNSVDLQNIMVKCIDSAGNISEQNFNNILVTSDTFKLYQKQIIAAIVAGLAVIIAGTIIIIIKKSRKNKKEV